jgi:acetyltransferase
MRFPREALLTPQAVALVGASRDKGSVGGAILANLCKGPDNRPVYAINPHPFACEGARWCARIEDLPEPCDLAIIALPAPLVPEAIAELGRRGTRVAVVISAGINRANGLRDRMLEAAAPYGLRIIGPNCLGALMPHAGINASFAPTGALPGGLAFLSQSGALTTAMLDWAGARGIGFSAVVSVGDMADVDFGELIALFADDPETKAILLYIEGISDAQRFMKAARAASRVKPVLAIKAGRGAAAGRAALSHTGALAGAYDVYQAAFRRAGIILVETLDELFDAAAVLAEIPPVMGDRLAIVTNGGGGGILAVDALEAAHGRLAALSDATLAELDRTLPPGWSRANPLDIIGDAHADRYRVAVKAALADPGVDAVLVINCPTALVSSQEVVDALIATVEESRRAGNAKPVLACWLGDRNAASAREAFTRANIPLFETPAEAVRGFSYLVQAERVRHDPQPLQRDVRGTEARQEAAEALLDAVCADGRTLLSEIEAKRLLALYDIPIVPTMLAPSAAAVADMAAGLEPPLVVKIVSPDITHKSDVGGVVLGLADARAARAAAEAMAERIGRDYPDARIAGFAVQPMIRRKQAHELFAGIASDPTFGPLVMFGAGGTAIEVLNDKAIGLPPIDEEGAREMVCATRISRLLGGYRDVAATNISAIASVLVALSSMATELPDIVELDINPLLADAQGAIALDARVVISR